MADSSMPPFGSPKAEFAWASIAGADPEPVEIIERDGRKGVLTIGCPDPFWLDDKSVRVRLNWERMERPDNVQTDRQRKLAETRYWNRAERHSWRGPR